MLALLTSTLLLLSAVHADKASIKWSNVQKGSYGLLVMPKPNGYFDFPSSLSNGMRPHIVSIYWLPVWDFNTAGEITKLKSDPKFGDFCLDVEPDAKNGTPLQIWECSASRPSQDWIWKDGHLKHVCSGLCVDVKDGQTGQTAQLWECFDGNKNQQFEIPADPWLPQGDPPRPSPTPI
ncbi:19 kDa protein having G-X-X-X-Q-X-W motif protein [Trichosporon asahii var. asahii CBS 8904]|uniref:19 kDa protein having G-X-X-X-Q-X-W motif protein n=1 Tax=Trichosporon asahii var. asahii (strain CBS 8904) TaxID=1220162 RepID=K1WIL9_TRIAC|nr:19 kDa protein having G-X-X-X-Q-X-W motif protein [Trichosporon asahii var. asahii CBS 8904]